MIPKLDLGNKVTDVVPTEDGLRLVLNLPDFADEVLIAIRSGQEVIFIKKFASDNLFYEDLQKISEESVGAQILAIPISSVDNFVIAAAE